MAWTEIVQLVALVLFCGAVLALFHWTRALRQQTQDISPPVPPTPALDTAIQDTAIQSLSSRLAAIEGRIGAIAATLDGFHVLQQRVAAIETNMPALQEAYEKYADSISRADKRDTERQRRYEKVQGQTAGDAAAALTSEAEAPTTPLGPASPISSDGKRIGILGHGGRGR